MKYVCGDCYSTKGSKRKMPGSMLIEIILWIFFLIPGIIYTIWRHAASKQVCKECGSSLLIPQSSPRAKAIIGGA